MIKYYLKFSIRGILSQKLYSLINILGLAIGICIFLLISLYVKHEYSYDKFNPNYDKILRMGLEDWCVIPPGVGHIMNGKFPEIDKICRFVYQPNLVVKYTPDEKQLEKSLTIETCGAVDSTFFDVFNVKLLIGYEKTALKDVNSVLITKRIALQLFGDEDPYNKVITINSSLRCKVTGVIDDSQNFHFKSDLYIPIITMYQVQGKERLETLQSWNYLTYLLLKSNDYDQIKLRDKIFNFLNDYENQGLIDENATPDFINLMPLKDIYFFKEAKHESGINHGNKPVVNAFIIIAIFIIVIALINFINLTTARASNRAKEVGVKKVVGSTQKKLISQFIMESVVISIIATILGIIFLQILLPEFNNLTLVNLSLTNTFFTAGGVLGIFLIALLIGILAGLYPAVYLSMFNTAKVLKGEITRGKTAGNLRIALIILQFLIAAILISGTQIVNRQINYMRYKNLGFDQNQVVNIILRGGLNNSSQTFKNRLLENPNIKGVSFSHGIPGFTRNTMTFTWNEDPIEMRITSADPDYFDVLGMTFKQGRGFSNDLQTDRRNTCVINETAARMTGWENPVGKLVQRNNNSWMVPDHFTIIGVFKDFHVESLHVPIVPMAIFWDEGTHYQGSIKINSDNIPQTLAYIEKVWNEFIPDFPFEYTFLDERFDQMYKSEDRMQKIVIYFSFLAIFIACLGLFGLSAFMTQRRFKEIGIRKVLGSSITQIVLKLSKEFALIVLTANLVAIPLAWILLNTWLLDYPYRIDIPFWVFPITLIITIFIGIITVSFHTIKVALGNPVEAIRHE